MTLRLLHWTRQLVVLPIRIYQSTLSRITPATCRFKPTCSQYTVEAIENRGVFIGGLHATWRILRCNPFTDGGWDLPPGSSYCDSCQPEESEPSESSEN